MEFDKSKILTAVTADQAKAGDMGWLSDTLSGIRAKVERGDAPEEIVRVLPDDYIHRFKLEVNAHMLFYPAPYEYFQAKWVKENRLQVGDVVKVLKGWKHDEQGFRKEFKKHYLDVIGRVVGINDDNINIQAEWTQAGRFNALVPYFAIEKVKEPSYEELQSRWVEANGLKVGDRVRITNLWVNEGDGFSDIYTCIGKEGNVVGINPDRIVLQLADAQIPQILAPYFAIEKVKGPTYAELQEQWVKGNGLNVGDKVKVINDWQYDEHGFQWVYITHYLGVTGAVISINTNSISIQTEKFQARVPYFAIEKVKDEYRPFANAEEFAPYRDRWFIDKHDSDIVRVELYCNSGITEVRGYCSYDELLNSYTFDDGTPAGVKL